MFQESPALTCRATRRDGAGGVAEVTREFGSSSYLICFTEANETGFAWVVGKDYVGCELIWGRKLDAAQAQLWPNSNCNRNNQQLPISAYW
jgi:hypothetical protein